MAQKTFKPQMKSTDGTMIDIKIPSTSIDGIDNYVQTTDSRLSDARTPLSHTHTKSEITDFPDISKVTSVDGLSGGTITSDVTVSGILTTKGNGVELYYDTPYIDFHYGNSTDDYTSRIIEDASGQLTVHAGLIVDKKVPNNENQIMVQSDNTEASIEYKNSNGAGYSWVVGQGCASLGNVFTWYSREAGVVRMKLDSSGNLTASNNVYASSVYASSDARLKKDIEDIKFDSENIIDNIKVRQYHWKKDDKQVLNVGCIAQELQEILPEDIKNFIVNVSDDEQKTLSVNDSKLVYILIDAYQKEKAKRVALEERLKKIEERLGL